MFGICYIKVHPTTYLIHYRKGKIACEGAGLSFFYFAPSSSLVALPMASTDVPFIFEETTADYQSVTLQGQVTYRVADPKRLAGLLNFTLGYDGRSYISDDPIKLPQRVINNVKVLARAEIQKLTLRDALRAADILVGTVKTGITESPEMKSLGLEVLGLSILAIKPVPETSRALEAETRERLMREADDAVYARRNSAVEQERAIKENELNTDIAVENKKRQIREAQMDAEKMMQERHHALKQADMLNDITLEEKRKGLVTLNADNTRAEADARAYGLSATVRAFSAVDAHVLQALVNAGMNPEQLIATAFQEIAGRADKIGQLNISPDLLRELMVKKGD